MQAPPRANRPIDVVTQLSLLAITLPSSTFTVRLDQLI